MLRFLFPPRAAAAETPTAAVSATQLGFKDMLHLLTRIRSGDSLALLLNTLPANQQAYLVWGTVACDVEETLMNEKIAGSTPLKHYTVVVYGKHGTDETPQRKRRQLLNLGFVDVYIYAGGIFEWALLQEVYGTEHFPSQGTPPRDLLDFSPPSLFARAAPLLLTS